MTDENREQELAEGPKRARPDWDLVGGEAAIPDDAAGPIEGEQPGDLPEEDDDNPYQESDEALPDDAEEKVIDRNPSREEKLFDDL